jgi:hypothetical protein
MQADRSLPGKDGSHSHFYRLLTKVMASLLTQKNVVEDLTRLVGSDHGDEISESIKALNADSSPIFPRDPHHQHFLSIVYSQEETLVTGHQETLGSTRPGRTMCVDPLSITDLSFGSWRSFASFGTGLPSDRFLDACRDQDGD